MLDLDILATNTKRRYDAIAIAGPLAAQSLSQVLDYMGHSTIQPQWIQAYL